MTNEYLPKKILLGLTVILTLVLFCYRSRAARKAVKELVLKVMPLAGESGIRLNSCARTYSIVTSTTLSLLYSYEFTDSELLCLEKRAVS